jgi:membrane fusion protein, multidrug efflux system
VELVRFVARNEEVALVDSWKTWAMILVLTAAACGCGCDDGRPAAAAAAPAAPAKISAQSAIQPEGVSASGPLIVDHQVDVAAQRDGVVVKILAEPGKTVKTGDLLAQLDDQQIASDLEAARAKTRSVDDDLKNWQAETKVLESDYQRALKMWDAQIITKEQLEHARYKLEGDQWDVKRVSELLANSHATERSLELELDKTRVRAPFNGVVARRYARVGQAVARGDRLFWVTAEGPLRLRFTLPEKFFGQLKRGQQLPLASPDVPDETFSAKIIEISPVVDPSSATVEVMVEVVGKSSHLHPGMTASVRIDTSR